MKDQVDALNANGIGADALNSNNEEGENAAIRERCKTGQTKILYISPERLQREIPWMQQHLNVSLFAIDEAHCISQWGHDFRPEYTQLGGLHQAFPSATIMALTATADKLTKEDIVRQLNLRDFKLFVSSFDRPNLRRRFCLSFQSTSTNRESSIAFRARIPRRSPQTSSTQAFMQRRIMRG